MGGHARRAVDILRTEGVRSLAVKAARRAAHSPGVTGRALRMGRRAAVIARTEGTRSLTVKALDRARVHLVTDQPALVPRQEIRMLVGYEDALEVDWTPPQPWATEPLVVRDRGLSTAWIMHPPGSPRVAPRTSSGSSSTWRRPATARPSTSTTRPITRSTRGTSSS
ncbi:hypothetical protein [Blastococcus brunescens]|uniref:Uncharacterized protein n=1 Tax=Blastococcus brunescens TaxID=1564165 RepID=A0ABZ1AZ70_9ACTN|nr:hypothetical protein [Blastococcus sp. BMG 8361]WRL62943.1 hypothetical protein U6N30_24250 [Blastococcus sp. BMG 8361]